MLQHDLSSWNIEYCTHSWRYNTVHITIELQSKSTSILFQLTFPISRSVLRKTGAPTSQNYLDILSDIMTTMDSPATLMRLSRDNNDNDACSQTTQTLDDNYPPPMTWKNDSTISDLSGDIFSHINCLMQLTFWMVHRQVNL